MVPNGLLADVSLRSIYRPIEHTIRDWQHTWVQDGVANTCIAFIIKYLSERGYTLQQVRSFMSLCSLPSKYGSVREEWLSDNRVKGESLTSFSSIVLSIVPILVLFIDRCCKRDPELADIVRWCDLMHVLLGVLSTGPDEAPHYAAKLRQLAAEFHELLCLLSTSWKPKLHHMHHIIDGIEWLGKSLSCFVTERKHRTIKDLYMSSARRAHCAGGCRQSAMPSDVRGN